MPLNKLNLADHLSDVFIETGTHRGDGVCRALEAGFETVYSCESDATMLHRISQAIWDDKRVYIGYGDSTKWLDTFLFLAKYQSVTFWLDAHPNSELSLIDGFDGRNKAPLLDELLIIARDMHLLCKVTILVDDMRLYSADDQERIEAIISDMCPEVTISRAHGHCADDILVGVM